MPKVMLEVNHSVMDNKIVKKIMGIKNDKKIIYNEDDFIITILVQYNKIVLTKSNKEYKITINFNHQKHTEALYEDYFNNRNLTLNVFTDKLVITNDEIIIIYKIEDEKIEYRLKYEVIE